MVQFRSTNSKMGTRDHSKNGTSLKNQMSKIGIALLFGVIIFYPNHIYAQSSSLQYFVVEGKWNSLSEAKDYLNSTITDLKVITIKNESGYFKTRGPHTKEKAEEIKKSDYRFYIVKSSEVTILHQSSKIEVAKQFESVFQKLEEQKKTTSTTQSSPRQTIARTQSNSKQTTARTQSNPQTLQVQTQSQSQTVVVNVNTQYQPSQPKNEKRQTWYSVENSAGWMTYHSDGRVLAVGRGYYVTDNILTVVNSAGWMTYFTDGRTFAVGRAEVSPSGNINVENTAGWMIYSPQGECLHVGKEQ